MFWFPPFSHLCRPLPGAPADLFFGLQYTVQQLISSLMTIGTFLSSLLVGPFSARFGRRHGLWAATVLNFVATSIQLGTTSKAALYVARLILGENDIYPLCSPYCCFTLASLTTVI